MVDPLKPDLTQAQMFLDDTLIAMHARVQRRVHPARKHAEPVLAPDTPWEGTCPVLYGTVLHREGRFRMWYRSFKGPSQVNICYAESDDGLRWRKPSLGLYEFDGSKQNNICFRAPDADTIDDVSVIEDDRDPDWPLKMLYWQSRDPKTGEFGIRAARSKDGIRWEALRGYALPEWGDRFNAMAHRDGGKFVVLGRAPGASERYGQDRTVSRTESEDLVHWTEPVLVHCPDLADTPHMRIYSATAFRYEGHLLGFLERMHMSPDLLDPELTFSHDGTVWRRFHERPAFIERGPLGTWDGNWVSLHSGPPILHRGRLWFYYSGRSGAHATPYPIIGGVGLATLRRDGFVSIGAAEQPGFLETVPLVWRGADLLVNADNRRRDDSHPNYPAGWVAAEVRDADGRIVEGFSLGDCLRIEHNTERRTPDGYTPIRWGGERRMGSLDGRSVRIRFVLKDARLFAFKGGGESR